MLAIGLVSTDEKARALKAFGADHVINTNTEDVAARVAEAAGGRGVDLVLQTTGGESLNQQATMLAPFGIVVSYGKMQAPIKDNLLGVLDYGPAYNQSPAIRFFTMHTFDDKPEFRTKSMRYLIDRLAAGEIKPLIHAKLPLKNARRAHEMLEARQVIGKVLLKP